MESLDSDMVREDSSFMTLEIRNYLMETARWGKFLAIMGYIGIGFLLIAGIFVSTVGGSASSLFPGSGINMAAFGLIYVVISVFYFFPVYYLHQFALKIKRGLVSKDSQDVATGFQNLKSLFKFMGIFTIIILSIYALIFVIAIVVGVAGLR